MGSLDELIGERVREVRNSRGLSLAALGNEVGKTSAHLSGLERGTKGWSVEMLHNVSDALNVPPWVFIETRPCSLEELFELATLVEFITPLRREMLGVLKTMVEALFQVSTDLDHLEAEAALKGLQARTKRNQRKKNPFFKER